jgi:imidazolonepropionase-like amidohydrolase
MKNLYTIVVLGLALALSGAITAGVQQPAPKPMALVGGTLIDGSNAAPIRDAVVLLRGDRIEKVGTVASLPVPAGYEQVSTEGMTVLPGLWDLHLHLQNSGHTSREFWHTNMTPRYEREVFPANAQILLSAGVTTARDMGTTLTIFPFIKRVDSGEIPGPTMYSTGPQIVHQPPAWASIYNWGVSGPADARAKAKQILDAGASFLKVTAAEDMTTEELRAIAEEAHSRGKKVAAHGRTNAEIKLGLQAGFDEFQHIGIGNNGPEYPEDVMAMIRERVRTGPPLYWCPTIQNDVGTLYTAVNREIMEDPANFRGFPPDMVKAIRESQAQFNPRPDPGMLPIIRRKFSQLREAGVQMLVGTDGGAVGNPHGQALWQELDGWVHVLGVEPITALRTATLGAAQYMGVERDNGSVTAGKYADVIAVRGDPLRNMGALSNPEIVIKHGRRIQSAR